VTHARPTIILKVLLAVLALLAVTLSLPTPLQAQQDAGNNIRASLVADGPPVPGKIWTAALHFVPRSPGRCGRGDGAQMAPAGGVDRG
jgi:hypothetical protein